MMKLQKREMNGGEVQGSAAEGYRFVLPPIEGSPYCLAQVDDYMTLPRRKFPYAPPMRIRLEARVSGPDLPGTWGFGLWNDPFSFGLGAGGMYRVLPVAPNAAWFFYGSSENHLTLWNEPPGSGFVAKTFQSPDLPSILSCLAIPALPLLLWPGGRRWVRKLARGFVREDSFALPINVEGWHHYELEWRESEVNFSVDGRICFQTPVSPKGRLGFVLWIDNQYFRFDPQGQLASGCLPVPDRQWLEVRSLTIESG